MIEHYGEYESKKIDDYANLSTEEKRLRIFERFFDNILDIVQMIRPKKVLYIAIDGVAPRAKQNQQRERRFISARDRKIKDLSKEFKTFDSASISPGTEFMHELSKFMYWKIRKYIQTRGDWHGIDVIYSPPTIPGEGEHKIMNYIRNLPKEEKKNASHCMFGPDGDLIVLTLSVHVNNISLFREDQFEKGYVDLVNMGMIRRGLAVTLGQNNYIRNRVRDEDDVSNDFAFIGFLVGNDFLPKIKMFYNLKDGLQKMFDIYQDILLSTDDVNTFLTKGSSINLHGLRIFFRKLANIEEKYIASQAIINAPEKKFIDNTLLKYAKVETLHTAIQGDYNSSVITHIDMKGYSDAYYDKERANIPKGSKIRCLNSMYRDYLRNLIWVYKYYTEKLPSWNEAYTWHSAPLMMDFSNYVDNLTDYDWKGILNFDKDENNHPALPFEQLLSILSPYSSNLLPERFGNLLTADDSELVKAGYYPNTFEMDCEGKFKDHQCIAVLPFPDYNIIHSAYTSANKLSKVKYHRNMIGNVYSFRMDEKYLSNFYSEYGDIIDCKVRPKII